MGNKYLLNTQQKMSNNGTMTVKPRRMNKTFHFQSLHVIIKFFFWEEKYKISIVLVFNFADIVTFCGDVSSILYLLNLNGLTNARDCSNLCLTNKQH